MYTGTIVEESLEDRNILGKVEVVSTIITDDENEADRWHIHTCKTTREMIEHFTKVLRLGWYCHFWNADELIIVYKNKVFYCERSKPTSSKHAFKYGITQGIPSEQLDFLVNE